MGLSPNIATGRGCGHGESGPIFGPDPQTLLRASDAADTVAVFLAIGALSVACKGEACDVIGIPEVAGAAEAAAASVLASASCLSS
jgi:hypothetical protein